MHGIYKSHILIDFCGTEKAAKIVCREYNKKGMLHTYAELSSADIKEAIERFR